MTFGERQHLSKPLLGRQGGQGIQGELAVARGLDGVVHRRAEFMRTGIGRVIREARSPVMQLRQMIGGGLDDGLEMNRALVDALLGQIEFFGILALPAAPDGPAHQQQEDQGSEDDQPPVVGGQRSRTQADGHWHHESVCSSDDRDLIPQCSQSPGAGIQRKRKSDGRKTKDRRSGCFGTDASRFAGIRPETAGGRNARERISRIANDWKNRVQRPDPTA